MDGLPIVWQRLVDAGGATCPRCQGTGEEVARAVERLKPLLAPMGLVPRLEVRSLDEAAFRASPLESNRILVDGRPMEDWLGAATGSSPCCAQCGSDDCRTVELSGRTYEVVPEELLVKAALAAGARRR